MAAGPKLDGAGIQKVKTLEDATTMLHRIHGLVETYAMAVRKKQPTSFTIQQIRRALPPLIGLLKGQFGMIADQVAVNYRKADITDRQKAMLDFAVRVSTEAYKVSEADFATLKSHGFTEDDMWDIAAISAFFGLSNRIANVTSMRPNPEFYSMGRG